MMEPTGALVDALRSKRTDPCRAVRGSASDPNNPPTDSYLRALKERTAERLEVLSHHVDDDAVLRELHGEVEEVDDNAVCVALYEGGELIRLFEWLDADRFGSDVREGDTFAWRLYADGRDVLEVEKSGDNTDDPATALRLRGPDGSIRYAVHEDEAPVTIGSVTFRLVPRGWSYEPSWGGAAKRLEDGQTLTTDGTTYTVEIVEEGG
ncbi:MAG: hypothetical protein ABEN55_04040 [Bradymonadaceae bacterium]